MFKFPRIIPCIALVGSIAFPDQQELRWDWAILDPLIEQTIQQLPKKIIFGTAVAEHQVSGATNCPHSNWAAWENAKDKHGQPRIHNGEKSGVACDFWNNYPQDIQHMLKLGVKAFRFSIEWSNIEPEQGKINQAAVRHYHDLIDALIAAGIEPSVTLHHFTHPQWFEAQGAFENEDNIKFFVDFAVLMAQEFGGKVTLWSTFNEPGVYIFQGYCRGVWPPGKIGLNRASWVYRNVMKAHVDAYQAMKKLPIGSKIQVGLVHDLVQFEPFNAPFYYTNYAYHLEKTMCDYMNHLFHDCITQFLATGKLEIKVPLLANLEYTNKAGAKSLDWIGLNYYSHVLLRAQLPEVIKPDYRPEELRTEMPYAIYPEGFYRAIKYFDETIAKPQGIPIYITENGISDAKDVNRALYIRRYLFAMHQAIAEGCNVKGYFYWSLLDNFEWAEGYSMKFGLYDVDMQTQKRTLRAGAQPLVNLLTQATH